MMKVILFSLALMATNSLSAQKKTDFFDEYYPISVKLEIARYTGTKTFPKIDGFELNTKNFTSPSFGLNLDFLHGRAFNFKTGLDLTLIREVETVKIEPYYNNLGYEVNQTLETSSEGMWEIRVPVLAEYFFLPTRSVKFFANAGAIVGYQSEDLTIGEYDFFSEDGNSQISVNTTYQRTQPWRLYGQLGFGAYFPLGGSMIRANFFYKKATTYLYYGNFRIDNGPDTADIDGIYDFEGNSFGVEFSMYLGKKKKEKK